MLKASPVIGDAEQPGQAQQEHGVEQAVLVGVDLGARRCGARTASITAAMPETSTRMKALSRSTRYSMPQGGAQPPRW